MNRNASIFTRILLSSLLPFALVFALACVVVADLIYAYNQRSVSQTVSVFAAHASEKIADNLGHIDSLLRLTSRNMACLADDLPGTEAVILELLHTFMEANPEIFCAWYVFKEGVLDDRPGWQARSFLKRDGVIGEIPAVTELDDPAVSPWHYYPFRTGKRYFDLLDHWDYGIGEGPHYTGTLAYPVIRDGDVIGSIGMDILYEKALRFMDRWHDNGGYRLMLVADSGDILHSEKNAHNGANLLDLGFSESDRQRIAATLGSGSPIQFEVDSPLWGDRSLVRIVPINVVGDDDHRLYLYLDLPLHLLYSDLRVLMRTLLLLCALGAVIIVFATATAARGIVRPIHRLTRLAEGIASGSVEVDAIELNKVSRTGPEVRVLAGALRDMLENMQQNHRLTLAAMETDYEKKKMEEAANARTQFFATMSHELRTPMNAIVGIAEILAAEDMPERQMNYVQDIKSSSESLLVIIDDILDVSRLDAGKLKLVPANFNLWRMLDNVGHLVEYLAKGKNLSFSLRRNGPIPEYVFADEVRTRQILVNLLGNAVKFTSAGSVELTATAEGEEILFEVKDTGMGIRESDRAALFDPFRQVDTTRNRNVKGTGLGLSISMNLAKLMGGSIEVESVYGKGSTFKVRLPLVKGEATRVIRRDGDDNHGIRAGARVLVVDDNEINLRVARGLMTMFGLECDTASSGWEAVEKACSVRYDLIFMDHMMPEMDGVEATRRIRGMGGLLTEVPIVAFTANSVAGVQAMLLEAGMNDFLSKPIRKEALVKVLGKWLAANEMAQKK